MTTTCRYEGPLGNWILVPDFMTADDCMKLAGVHRRAVDEMLTVHKTEPCPDLLEAADLWERAAADIAKRLQE